MERNFDPRALPAFVPAGFFLAEWLKGLAFVKKATKKSKKSATKEGKDVSSGMLGLVWLNCLGLCTCKSGLA